MWPWWPVLAVIITAALTVNITAAFDRYHHSCTESPQSSTVSSSSGSSAHWTPLPTISACRVHLAISTRDTVASSSSFSLQTQAYIALGNLHAWHCGFKYLFQSANTSIHCTWQSPCVTLWLQVPISVCKHKHILHFAISMGDTVASSSSFSLQTRAYIVLCNLHAKHCGFKLHFQSANISIYCTLQSLRVTRWLIAPLSVCKHKHILHFAISMGDTVADSSSFSLQTQA